MTTDTTTTGPRFAHLDRKAIVDAHKRFTKGDAHALADCIAAMGTTRFMNAAPQAIRDKLAAIAPQRTARAATDTRDPIKARRIAANHDFIREHGQAAWRAKRAGLPYTPAKAQRAKVAAKPVAAAPKAPRRISDQEAYVIRARGTQAQRDALTAQEAAEHPASCRCTSCDVVKYRSRAGAAGEGTAELAALLKQHAPNANAVPANKPAMSQAEISRTWRDAHEKVARETGRIR